jgi:MOB kinase activator 1
VVPFLLLTVRVQVALPPGESCAAWVAVHAIDFYNDVSTLWAVMAADPYLATFQPGDGFPSGVEYRWSEPNVHAAGGESNHNVTVSVSAPVYIDKVLHWIAEQMNDEQKFPDDEDEEKALRVFQTPQFAALCGQIFRRLFRIYAIIYSSFFGTLEALEMAAHLNTAFKHFMFFCTEFGLLPEREVEPLEVLVQPIRRQYYNAKTKSPSGVHSGSTSSSTSSH